MVALCPMPTTSGMEVEPQYAAQEESLGLTRG